jgi:hypothetical protein
MVFLALSRQMLGYWHQIRHWKLLIRSDSTVTVIVAHLLTSAVWYE